MQCVELLMYFYAGTYGHKQVRQIAAIELRKRVAQNSGELWLQLDQAQREEIKSKLPELVLADPQCVVSFLLVFDCSPRLIANLYAIQQHGSSPR